MEIVISAREITELRACCDKYDKITIDLKSFYFHGLLSHGLKYASIALRKDGFIIIKFGDMIRKVGDRSEVCRIARNQFIKTVSEYYTDISFCSEKIIARKMEAYRKPEGFSIGILFSGMESERESLEQCLESVPRAIAGFTGPFEVNISTSASMCSYIKYLMKKYPSLRIRHHSHDPKKSDRFMVGIKKNSLFKFSTHDGVIICHNRIRFGDHLMGKLIKFPFEIASPQVNIHRGNDVFRYLDYCLVEKYDMGRPNRVRTLCGDWITEDYLKMHRRRVPYVDGGIIFINRNYIKKPPWNPALAWGEAEDVDLCERAHQQGYLIDYIHEIECVSNTNKYKVRELGKRLLIRSLKPLIRIGVI